MIRAWFSIAGGFAAVVASVLASVSTLAWLAGNADGLWPGHDIWAAIASLWAFAYVCQGIATLMTPPPS